MSKVYNNFRLRKKLDMIWDGRSFMIVGSPFMVRIWMIYRFNIIPSAEPFIVYEKRWDNNWPKRKKLFWNTSMIWWFGRDSRRYNTEYIIKRRQQLNHLFYISASEEQKELKIREQIKKIDQQISLLGDVWRIHGSTLIPALPRTRWRTKTLQKLKIFPLP